MLPPYAPWFYWNFVGATRDKLLDILAPEQVYELICNTRKSKMWGRSYYPVENPPGTIRAITGGLERAGTFHRILNKK